MLVERNELGQLQAGNSLGRTRNPARKYVNKLHAALNIAVDKLGDKMKTDGATAMGTLIAEALEEDVVGTLHKLSPFFPKNINLDVNVTKEASDLSDDELEAIILERRKHKDNQQVIDAEVIRDDET